MGIFLAAAAQAQRPQRERIANETATQKWPSHFQPPGSDRGRFFQVTVIKVPRAMSLKEKVAAIVGELGMPPDMPAIQAISAGCELLGLLCVTSGYRL